MDRACRVRGTWRRVLLVALLIQVLTPDVLDLLLLSQSLPPGPIFVVSSLKLRADAPEAAQRRHGSGLPSSPEHSSARLDREDGDADSLCAPLWPELGLTRHRGLGPVPRQGSGACQVVGPAGRSRDANIARAFFLLAGSDSRPNLYGRLSC